MKIEIIQAGIFLAYFETVSFYRPMQLISCQINSFMMCGCDYKFSKLMKSGVNLRVANWRVFRV